MEGISIWQLIIVMVILLLLFGTKKVRSIGTDLGHSIRGFKQALNKKEDDTNTDTMSEKTDEKKEDKQ
ncbi:MAG: twin-arginine translocase TatA/TatE family subunit [Pseudomonadota bacterium]